MTLTSRPIAVVTGGASGIGRAVAERFAASAYRVYSLDRTAPTGGGKLVDLIEQLQVDVSNRAQVEAAVELIMLAEGQVDVVVCCAGVKPPDNGLINEAEVDVWDQAISVNLTGTYRVIQAVLPHMTKAHAGLIVTIGSPSANGDARSIGYAAAKAGVSALTTSLARGLAEFGIRVAMVVPGMTEGAMTSHLSSSQVNRRARLNPAGRINTPDDVAAVVEFLASPQASMISGAVIDVGAVHRTPVLVPADIDHTKEIPL